MHLADRNVRTFYDKQECYDGSRIKRGLFFIPNCQGSSHNLYPKGVYGATLFL